MPNIVLKNGRTLEPETIRSWPDLVGHGSEAVARFAQEHPERAESLRRTFEAAHGARPVQPDPIVPPIPVPGK
jgi:hypothetical protein